MLKKIIIFLFLFLFSLSAEITIDTNLVKNGSSYLLNSGDIVFKDDKIKFKLNSTVDDKLDIYYKVNDKEEEKLSTMILKKNSSVKFPSSSNFIVLDDEEGTLTFIFKSSIENKKLTLLTNPKASNTEILKKKYFKENERLYINRSKIISNSRGDKEANIIIPKLESSTVIIEVEESIGAGVIINNEKNILTNYHVIEENEKEVYIAFKPKLGNKPSKNNYYKVDVIKVDMNRDLALLSFPKTELSDFKYSSIELANSSSLKKGIDIYNMGHPLGYYYAFEYGMLTNILNDYSWTTYKADYVLQYSMNSNKGNSGSPIVNNNLELIGIGAFSNLKGKNLNFAISVVDVKSFLNAEKSIRIEKKDPNSYKDKIIEKGFYRNVRLAKLDRNGNGVIDAMMKDINNDGVWNIIAYDTNEDGIFEKKTSF